MKRFLFYLLISFSLFSIASCGDDDDDDSKQTTPSNNDSNVTPNPGNDTNNDKPATEETKTFTVTFNADGGSEVAAQTVEDGKSAAKPEDPTKEGFDLEGWFNGESLYDFSAAVTSDLTLTAKWNIKTFTVTFDTDGGSEVGSQVVEYGKSVTAPEKPSKDGFFFMGWYVGENLYDFSQPVSNDLTIKALWMGEYVDLGLPSGTLWASCNVGAENPWDYGDYFAWGETTTKDAYKWETYTYNDNSDLDAQHDAATVNMGSNWRMPTKAEFQELLDNCDCEWTDDYNGTGVAGRIVKSRNNSNSLFLPASGYRDGYRDGSELWDDGSDGYYWSSSVYDVGGNAWFLDFGHFFADTFPNNSFCGFPVRAVRCRN